MSRVDGDPHDGLTVVSADTLGMVEDLLHEQADRCAEALRWARMADGPGLDGSAIRDLDRAIAAVTRAANGLTDLADAVARARTVFDLGEQAVRSIVDALSAQVAALLGLVALPVLGATVVALSLPALVLAKHIAQLPPDEQEQLLGIARAGLEELARRAASPEATAAIGWLADNVGTMLLGTVGMPPHVASFLGEHGVDAVNLEGVAVVASAIAVLFGASGLTPVRVIAQPVPSSGGAQARQIPAVAPGLLAAPVTAPTTVEDRARRVPDGGENQVRIERYEDAHGPYFEVYIAGTDPAAPPGGSNPFDMLSNVALVGALDASSLEGVRLALAEAGATGDSRVVFTGHSQGALIASFAAESGEWDTVGLVTIGGPLGDVPVTGDYPAIVVEHSDDIVVPLTGEHRDTRATVVEARAYPDGADDVFAPHSHQRYTDTARQVDDSADFAVTYTRDRLPSEPSVGIARVYRVERLSPADGD